MSDRIQDPEEPLLNEDDANSGVSSADVLSVAAVSMFLAAIGLVAFFLTTAVGA